MLCCKLSCRGAQPFPESSMNREIHIKDVLSFTERTGDFFWLVTNGRMRPGDRAGGLTRKGYLTVQYAGKKYAAHRLAWFFVYGEFPRGEIDHINGIRTDNRISNLRIVSRTVNCQNSHRLRRDNTSGHRGVSIHTTSGLWQAQITVDKKPIHLGYFKTKECAAAAYVAAKRELHPGWVA